MHPKDADGMANSVDPDQTASSEAVWSWSALFAETYLSQYIEFVRYKLYKSFLLHQKKLSIKMTNTLSVCLIISLYVGVVNKKPSHFYQILGSWDIWCFEPYALYTRQKGKHTVGFFLFSELDEIFQIFHSITQSSTSLCPKLHLIRSEFESGFTLEIREGSKSNVTNVSIWSKATICAQTHCTPLTILLMEIVTLKLLTKRENVTVC